jgi:hypothetical protein
MDHRPQVIMGYVCVATLAARFAAVRRAAGTHFLCNVLRD